MPVLLLSRSPTQALELASVILYELMWRSLLHDCSLVHDQNLAAWHDCLYNQSPVCIAVNSACRSTHPESMRDDQDGNSPEFFVYNSRNLGISLGVDASGGFVQNQNLVLLE